MWQAIRGNEKRTQTVVKTAGKPEMLARKRVLAVRGTARQEPGAVPDGDEALRGLWQTAVKCGCDGAGITVS